MEYRSALVLTMATRVAAVIDMMKSDFMAMTSDIKTGIRIRDFVHWKYAFRLSSVFEMMTSDYQIYDISNSESGENRYSV